MEWEGADVNEQCFIMSTSTLDFRPWIPDEITLLCLPASSRTTTTAVNKMFRGFNEYSIICLLSLDSDLITNILSHAGLVKLSMVDGANTKTMYGI